MVKELSIFLLQELKQKTDLKQHKLTKNDQFYATRLNKREIESNIN